MVRVPGMVFIVVINAIIVGIHRFKTFIDQIVAIFIDTIQQLGLIWVDVWIGVIAIRKPIPIVHIFILIEYQWI